MSYYDYIRSDDFDNVFKELINLQDVSVSMIQSRWKKSFYQAKILYEEWCYYNDEVYIHNILYELSFEDEPPTIARIMGRFRVSYRLAEKVFQIYMEDN